MLGPLVEEFYGPGKFMEYAGQLRYGPIRLIPKMAIRLTTIFGWLAGAPAGTRPPLVRAEGVFAPVETGFRDAAAMRAHL